MNPFSVAIHLGERLMNIPIRTYIGSASISQICCYALMIAIVGYLISKLF